MRTKVFQPTYFKMLPDSDGKKGQFEAVVSTFDTLDLQGERVRRGAFDASLKAWRASNDPIPVLHDHRWSDVYAHVGWINPSDAMEVAANAKGRHPAGLYVRGQFDLDKPYAKQVYDLAKARRLKEWSIGYEVFPGGEHVEDDRSNALTSLDLIEISITLKGANTETVSLGIKSDAQKSDTKAVDRYVRWGEAGWHDRHLKWMAMQSGTPACACSELQLCREHAAKLDTSRPYTKRAGRCPTCGTTQSFDVRPAVPGGSVPYAQCTCGALIGWSSLPKEQFVQQMKLVRAHVGPAVRVDPEVAAYKAELESILADWSPPSRKYERVGGHDEIREIQAELARLDPNTKKIRSDISDRRLEERIRMEYSTQDPLIAELDALDPAGAKYRMAHLPRTTEAASRAVADAIITVDGARDRLGHLNSLKAQLELALRQLRLALQSLATDAADVPKAAGHAIQAAQSIGQVSQLVRVAGYRDVADDLDGAVDRIFETCEALAPHQLAPPASVEVTGGKMTMIPASMWLVEEQATAQPVEEESFALETYMVADQPFRIEDGHTRGSREAPIPVESGETFRLDVAGAVDATESSVGETYRFELDEGQRNLIDGDQVRIEQDDDVHRA